MFVPQPIVYEVIVVPLSSSKDEGSVVTILWPITPFLAEFPVVVLTVYLAWIALMAFSISLLTTVPIRPSYGATGYSSIVLSLSRSRSR